LLGIPGSQRETGIEVTIQKRFYAAMAAYAVIAVAAGLTLDGKLRLGVWILLAGLAVKTVIAYKTSSL
jgi:hypothetical protein